MTLDPVQVRVLGSLMEKETATPEAYPLSLNALLAACNQKSSRDPVMDLSEEQVRQALHGLEDLGLTAPVRDSRVVKYEHLIRTVLNLRRDEAAILCLLFLRGPQTPGELRSRSERLYNFDGLDAVDSTLERMTRSSPALEEGATESPRPLVAMLPRQPGSREARYAHLLGGPVATAAGQEAGGLRSADSGAGNNFGRAQEAQTDARLTALEAEVAALRLAITSIEARLGEPAEDN
ncbi:MAG: YceH family protein [Acidobacteriaceae bacterium]|jgi:uncharacterized protein YceH (UPF0502 family)